MNQKSKNKKRQLTKGLIIEPLEPLVLFSADSIGVGSDILVPEEKLDSTDELSQMAIVTPPEIALSTHVVFVDPDVAESDALIDSITSASDDQTEFVVYILGQNDSITSVSDKLQSHTSLAAIHFITHATDANISLGSTTINSESLAHHNDELTQWSNSLDNGGDILFYGCNLAHSQDGKFLIDQIATATQADIAASDDLTGHTRFGADWRLEYTTGPVGGNDSLFVETLAQWNSVLPTATIVVTTPGDVIDADPQDLLSADALNNSDFGTDGKISLREALIAANAEPDQNTIIVPAGQYDLTIPDPAQFDVNLDDHSGDLDITNPVTLIGAGAGTDPAIHTIIDAANINDRVMNISYAGQADISDLVFTNGTTTKQGGGLYSILTTIDLERVHVTNNKAQDPNPGSLAYGGGIYIEGGSGSTFREVEITGNTTTHDGGGLYVYNNPVGIKIYDSKISYNSTEVNSAKGGGLKLWNGSTVHAYRTEFSHNNAPFGEGGGVHVQGAFNAEDSTFSHNNAGYGGGLEVENGFISIKRSLFDSNTAYNGGGLHGSLSAALIEDSTISRNTATGTGSAAHVSDREFIFNRSTIVHNDAPIGGAALAGGGITIGGTLLAYNGDDAIHSTVESRGNNYSDSPIPGADGSDIDDATTGDMDNTLVSSGPNNDAPAYNGGIVASYALLPGSDAVDAYSPILQSSVDIRNVPHTYPNAVDINRLGRDNNYDIGAYEIVSPVNSNPTVSVNFPKTMNDDESILIDRLYLATIDPDLTDTLTYTILTPISPLGELRLGGIPVNQGDTFTQTDIDNELLIYERFGLPGDGSFTFEVNDGSNPPVTDTFTITANSVNSAPVISGLNSNLVHTPTTTSFFASGATISDPELDDLNNGNGDYTGATLSIDASGITGSVSLNYIYIGGDGISFYPATNSHTVNYNGTKIASIPQPIFPALQFEFENNGVKPTTEIVNKLLRHIAVQSNNSTSPLLFDISLNDGNAPDGVPAQPGPQGAGGPQSSTQQVLQFDVVDPAEPAIISPASATTDEDTPHAFTANDFIITESLAGSNNMLRVSASVTNGTITFPATPGITFVDGTSNNTSSVVIEGLKSAVNQAFDGLIYTPDTDYFGADTLSVDASLNAGLEAHYAFDGNLTNQVTTAVNTDGQSFNGSAAVLPDSHLDLSLTNTGPIPYVEIPSNFDTQITNAVTLSARVSVITGNPEGSEVISIGNNIMLRIYPDRIEGEYYDGTTYHSIDANQHLVSTGARHIAYTLDTTEGIQKLFLDGIEVASGAATNPIHLDPGQSTYLGSRPPGEPGNHRFMGYMDEVRIHSRDVSDEEIRAMFAEVPLSVSENTNINVVPINDAPILTAIETIPVPYNENAGPVAITSSLNVSDIDSANLEGATVSFTGGNSTNDVLIFNQVGSGSITAMPFDPATGSLELSGIASPQEYQAALRAITFENTAVDPATQIRTVSFTVNDGDLDSLLPTSRDITITPVNDAPQLTSIETQPALYVENGIVGITGTITVSDPDNPNLEQAAVTINNGFNSAEDVLSLDSAAPAGITGTYNNSTGTLTLTGPATLAEFETALRLVKYENTSENPDPQSRRLDVTISDGDLSDFQLREIDIISVNDAPVFQNLDAINTYVENGPPTTIEFDAAIQDLDLDHLNNGLGNYDGATLTILRSGVSGPANNDSYTLLNGNNLTLVGSSLRHNGFEIGTWNVLNGQLEINFSSNVTAIPTTTMVGNVLNQIQYSNATDTLPANILLDWTFEDGSTGSQGPDSALAATGTTSFTVVPPQGISITSPPAVQTNEDSALSLSTATATLIAVTDETNSDSLVTVFLKVDNGTVTLPGTVNVIQGTNGSAGFVVEGLQSDINTALDNLIYTPDPNYNGADSLVVKAFYTADMKAQYLFDGTSLDNRSIVKPQDDPNNANSVAGTFVNGQHDTSLPPADYISVDSERGEVLELEGNGEALVIDSAFDIEDAVTIATWINFDTPNPNGSEIFTISNNVMLRVDQTQRLAGVYEQAKPAGSQTWNYSGTKVSPNEQIIGTGWRHVAYTIDTTSQTQVLYIDGIEVERTNHPEGIETGNPDYSVIGNRQPSQQQHYDFIGKLDDIRVYTRAITAEEVQAIYLGNDEATGVTNITVNPVNDPPVVDLDTTDGSTIVDFETSFTEGAPPTPITSAASAVNISDVDHSTLFELVATIQNVGDTGQEFLNAGLPQGWTQTYSESNGAGVLIITPPTPNTTTHIPWEYILANITYQNTSEDPDTTQRQISIEANDGTGTNNPLAISLVNVSKENDPPVLASVENTALAYTENSSGLPVSSTIQVTDVDSVISSATISIVGNFTAGEDELIFNNFAGITASYNVANGVLQLNGTASVTDYEAALRSIEYRNTSDTPNTLTRTVAFQVKDQTDNSNTTTRDIDITPDNDAPELATLEAQAAKHLEGTPTGLTGNLSITDRDNTSLTSATITISNNFIASEDELTFDNALLNSQYGIDGSYNPSTGTLTLTALAGSAGFNDFEKAIHSIHYQTNSDNPTTVTRTIDFKVSDGVDSSNVLSRQMEIYPVNDAPIALDSNVTVTEDTAYSIPFAQFGFSDPAENHNLLAVNVDVSDPRLSIDANAQSVIYTPAPDSTAPDQFSFTVQDDGGGMDTSTPAVMNIAITPVNDAPAISDTSVSAIPEDSSPAGQTIGSLLAGSFSDQDPNDTLAGIAITQYTVLTGDGQWQYQPPGGQWTPTDNTPMQLSDTHALLLDTNTLIRFLPAADYTGTVPSLIIKALDSSYTGVFSSSAQQQFHPNLQTTGGTTPVSNSAKINGQITPAEDPPNITHATLPTQIEDTDVTNAASVSDLFAPGYSDIDGTPEMFGIAVVANAATANQGAWQYSPDGTNWYNINSVSTTDALVLHKDTKLKFYPTANYFNSATDTNTDIKLEVMAIDGTYSGPTTLSNDVINNISQRAEIDTTSNAALFSSVRSATVHINPVNDAPVLSAIESTPLLYTENDPAVAVSSAITAGDVDDTQIASAIVQIVNHNPLTDALVVDSQLLNSQYGISSNFDQNTGSITLSGPASIADYTAAIRAIGYQNSSENPGAVTKTVQIKINDGSTDSNTITRELTLTPVNDAPTAISSNVTVTEDTPYTIDFADFGFTDLAEGHTLQSVIVDTANNAKLTYSPSGTGVIYTPLPDSTAADQFSFRVQDDGGTANGGADTSAPVLMNVNVSPVNDAPVIASAILPGSAEDSNPAGQTFAALFGATHSDADPSDTLAGVAITGNTQNTADGEWQYRVTGGSWQPVGSVSANNALMLSANTLVRFLPAADFNGNPAPLSLSAADNSHTGGFTTVNRVTAVVASTGADAAYSNTATLGTTITAVNDAPVINDAALPAQLEDTTQPIKINDLFAAQYSDADGTLAIAGIAITENLANAAEGSWQYSPDGTLWYNINSVSDTNALVLDKNSMVRFTPAADFFGDPGDLSVRAIDGTYNGSTTSSNTNRIIIDAANSGNMVSQVHAISIANILPVNDAPQGANNTITTLEDSPYAFSLGDFGFSDPIDADAFFGITVKSIPADGVLTHNGQAVNGSNWIAANSIAAGNLVYTPDSNRNGAGIASWDFAVSDNGGIINGGTDQSPSDNTITIDVTPVNDAPVGSNGFVQSIEGVPIALTESDFGFNDLTDGHSFTGVLIDTLPLSGNLLLNSTQVTVGQWIQAADINSNLLTFTATSSNQSTVDFRVVDSGGTANGGEHAAIASSTITFGVTPPPNTPPTASGSTIALNEDTTYTFVPADFMFADADGHGLHSILIIGTPILGNLALNNVPVAAGDTIPSADIVDLTFTPEPSAYGSSYTTLEFKVTDNGTTAGGGSNESVNTETITFDVMAVNDAPTASDNTIEIVETTAYPFKLTDFGFSDPIDQNSFHSVTIESLPTPGVLMLNQTVVSTGSTISAANIASGLLQYTPVQSEVANQTSFTFKVTDNGGISAGGNNTTIIANTLTINISTDNTRPTSTSGILSTLEDTAVQLNQLNFGFTDSDGHGMAGIVITSLPANGILLAAGSPVTQNQFIPTATLDAGELTFLADPDTHSNNYASLDFLVLDNGSSQTGKHVAASSSTLTFNVQPVNDAPANPSLNGDLNIDENATAPNIASVTFTDADNSDTHQLSINDNRFEVANGTLSLKPGITIDHEIEDVIPLQLTVTDSQGASVTHDFILQIADVNEAPVVTQQPQNQIGTTPFSFAVPANTFFDTDNDELQLTATSADGAPLPEWLQFDPQTSTFTITGEQESGQSTDVIIHATDPDGLATSTIITVTVEPAVVEPPVAAASPVVDTEPFFPVIPAVAPQAEIAEEDEVEEGTKPPDSNDAPLAEELFSGNSVAVSDEAVFLEEDRNQVVQIETPNTDYKSEINIRGDKAIAVRQNADFRIQPDALNNNEKLRQETPAFIAMSLKSLAEMADDQQTDINNSQVLDTKVLAASVTLTSSFSVGYVLWLLRGGTLLASVMASLPAWRAIDPLPVLESLTGDNDDDTETLESMVEESEEDTAAPESDANSSENLK